MNEPTNREQAPANEPTKSPPKDAQKSKMQKDPDKEVSLLGRAYPTWTVEGLDAMLEHYRWPYADDSSVARGKSRKERSFNKLRKFVEEYGVERQDSYHILKIRLREGLYKDLCITKSVFDEKLCRCYDRSEDSPPQADFNDEPANGRDRECIEMENTANDETAFIQSGDILRTDKESCLGSLGQVSTPTLQPMDDTVLANPQSAGIDDYGQDQPNRRNHTALFPNTRLHGDIQTRFLADIDPELLAIDAEQRAGNKEIFRTSGGSQSGNGVKTNVADYSPQVACSTSLHAHLPPSRVHDAGEHALNNFIGIAGGGEVKTGDELIQLVKGRVSQNGLSPSKKQEIPGERTPTNHEMAEDEEIICTICQLVMTDEKRPKGPITSDCTHGSVLCVACLDNFL